MIPERLKPLLDDLRPLAEAFDAGGHRLYLVGGVVRELLAGREIGMEVDLTTDALPEETRRLMEPVADSVWTQGEKFGTIGARIDGRDVEITTHRAEAYLAESRKPVVRYSESVTDDLARRDFTVNAMALAVPDLELIDPFDGAADLAASRLRTPLAPEESFGDDPLRMLRAARFIAGYGLQPSGAIRQAVEDMRDRLEIVSGERIRDELDKLLVVEDPSEGLWFLVDTGLAEEFLPELPALRVEQDPIHRHKDVLAHTIAVVAKTGRNGKKPDKIVRLAALLHDIGKPKTRVVRGQGGVVPPPRGGRCPHGPGTHAGPPLSQRRDRCALGHRLGRRGHPRSAPRTRRPRAGCRSRYAPARAAVARAGPAGSGGRS